MGPVRGRLTLITLWMLSPSLAQAEVCSLERPDWDGTPATLFSEAVGLFLSPAGLILTAALVVAVLFRHAMGTALVALLWSFFITALVTGIGQPNRAAAIQEGCAASPTLFIAMSSALCLAAVAFTFRKEKTL